MGGVATRPHKRYSVSRHPEGGEAERSSQRLDERFPPPTVRACPPNLVFGGHGPDEGGGSRGAGPLPPEAVAVQRATLVAAPSWGREKGGFKALNI